LDATAHLGGNTKIGGGEAVGALPVIIEDDVLVGGKLPASMKVRL